MKNPTKVTISIGLSALFLLACTIALLVMFFAGWLHTYSVFTREVTVAKVKMHPIKKDDLGEYIDIEFTPLIQQSALTTYVNPNVAPIDEVGVYQRYRLYGDTVAIGGPIVKFHDELILFNFATIYKLARIRGVYEANIQAEKNRTVFSTYDINGGFDDTWWTLNDNEGEWPYNMFVDRVQFSVPGEPGFRSEGIKEYEIVITEDGFAWKLISKTEK